MKNSNENKTKMKLLIELYNQTDDLTPLFNWINSDEKKVIKEKTTSDDADKIYSLYPAKCPFRGASLGKCSKNKVKIDSLIRSNSYSSVFSAVSSYLSDCKQHKVYLKNFTTLLNGLEIDKVLLVKPNNDEVSYLINGMVKKSFRSDVPSEGIILKNA